MAVFKKKPTMCIIHCSATKEGQDFDVNDIDKWHKARGWSGVGYHIIIKLDGTVQHGRSLHHKGAHAKYFNHKSFGVCYIGGLDSNGKPKDTRTEAQKKSLIAVIDFFKKDYEGLTVHGHNEFSNKACPSFDVSKEFN
tara:strand:- start:296 stop:709 length:414 start_codon:yes stop_codon:yes gene_type:complete